MHLWFALTTLINHAFTDEVALSEWVGQMCDCCGFPKIFGVGDGGMVVGLKYFGLGISVEINGHSSHKAHRLFL